MLSEYTQCTIWIDSTQSSEWQLILEQNCWGIEHLCAFAGFYTPQRLSWVIFINFIWSETLSSNRFFSYLLRHCKWVGVWSKERKIWKEKIRISQFYWMKSIGAFAVIIKFCWQTNSHLAHMHGKSFITNRQNIHHQHKTARPPPSL